MHFVRPDFYMKIMPPYLPFHLELVYLSGLFEIALGLLLLDPRFSRLAAWGIIALLIAIFPANIYVYRNQDLLPASPTASALPFQLPCEVDQDFYLFLLASASCQKSAAGLLSLKNFKVFIDRRISASRSSLKSNHKVESGTPLSGDRSAT